MAYKNTSTRREESKQFPGVVFHLRKMTEGRRKELRRLLSPINARVSAILREQDIIDAAPAAERDHLKSLALSDQVDTIFLEESNPIWIKWGVKAIEGLESEDGVPLTVEDYDAWPSELFHEVLAAVKSEAELNGAERKNSELPITSGKQEGGNQSPSTAQAVESTGGGEIETAGSTLTIV